MNTALTRTHDREVGLSSGLMKAADLEIDDVIDKALAEDSPVSALAFGFDLINTIQFRGVQLMRLLYRLEENWDRFETEDTIEDAVFKIMGVSHRKFSDYTRVYRYILKDHPELIGKPIGGLLEIIAAARDGDFSDEDWAALEMARDKAEMIRIRKNARGEFGQSYTRVTIRMDENGLLWAHKENKEPELLGQINTKPNTDHGRVALSRLLRKRVYKT